MNTSGWQELLEPLGGWEEGIGFSLIDADGYSLQPCQVTDHVMALPILRGVEGRRVRSLGIPERSPDGRALCCHPAHQLRVCLGEQKSPVPTHGPTEKSDRSGLESFGREEGKKLVDEHALRVVPICARMPVAITAVARSQGNWSNVFPMDVLGQCILQAERRERRAVVGHIAVQDEDNIERASGTMPKWVGNRPTDGLVTVSGSEAARHQTPGADARILSLGIIRRVAACNQDADRSREPAEDRSPRELPFPHRIAVFQQLRERSSQPLGRKAYYGCPETAPDPSGRDSVPGVMRQRDLGGTSRSRA